MESTHEVVEYFRIAADHLLKDLRSPSLRRRAGALSRLRHAREKFRFVPDEAIMQIARTADALDAVAVEQHHKHWQDLLGAHGADPAHDVAEATSPDLAFAEMFASPLACHRLEGEVIRFGPEDDPDARLLARIRIAGVAHHATAVAVRYDEERHIQVADLPYGHGDFEEINSILDDIAALHASDGPLATVDLAGRKYVLAITPCGA